MNKLAISIVIVASTISSFWIVAGTVFFGLLYSTRWAQ